jgi:hypothetical protein
LTGRPGNRPGPWSRIGRTRASGSGAGPGRPPWAAPGRGGVPGCGRKGSARMAVRLEGLRGIDEHKEQIPQRPALLLVIEVVEICDGSLEVGSDLGDQIDAGVHDDDARGPAVVLWTPAAHEEALDELLRNRGGGRRGQTASASMLAEWEWLTLAAPVQLRQKPPCVASKAVSVKNPSEGHVQAAAGLHYDATQHSGSDLFIGHPDSMR